MPSYSKALFAFVFLSAAVALPTPQLAGEGKALDSLFTDTDNGVGYGTENAENNLAATISGGKVTGSTVPASSRRQLAGEGKALDSLFTDTDNGVGYGIENAENNLAATISGGKVTGSTVPASSRRQLDKISNGFQAVSGAAGAGDQTKSLTGTLDSVDGALTDGAANAGAQVGATEESTLEAAGNAVPKERRQLDKISNGAQTLSQAAGAGDQTKSTTGNLDSIDGTLTDGAANAGADTGATEEALLEEAGNAVPKL